MTISKYIVDFLHLYEDIEIETNHLKDGSDKYGLFKSPNRERDTAICYMDTITEHYQFLAKKSNNSKYDREESEEWLEDLTYWVDDYESNYDYPRIDGNRTVTDIQLTGCPYPMESTEDETLYQVSLSITYEREREVD